MHTYLEIRDPHGREEIDVLTDNITADNNARETEDYFTVVNYEQKVNSDITCKDLVINTPVLTTCLVIAFVAASAYLDSAAEAAHGDEAKAIAYQAGALIFNVLISLYFEMELVGPLINEYINSWLETPSDVTNARLHLQDKNTSGLAKVARLGVDATVGMTTLALATGASFPNYALDVRSKKHSIERSVAVLIASVPLMWASTKSLLFYYMPMLWSPLEKIWRYFDREKDTDVYIRNTYNAFKIAHLETIRKAHNECLHLIQIGRVDVIQPLINLVANRRAGRRDTINSILQLCKLAPSREFELKTIDLCNKSISGADISAFLSYIGTGLSVYGLWPLTEDATKDVFKTGDSVHGEALAIGIFLITIAIAFDVSEFVARMLYSKLEYFFRGAYNNYQESNGLGNFLHRAWTQRNNPESWYSLIQLPLAAIHHPKVFIFTMLGIIVGSGFSVQTSIILNLPQLAFITAVMVMIFNSFPGDKILAEVLKILDLLFGTQEKKDQIGFEQFLKRYERFIEGIDPYQFIKILNGFVNNGHMTPEQKEATLRLFFGNRPSSDILPTNHENAGLEYRLLVPGMLERRRSHLRLFTFFTRPFVSEQERINEETALTQVHGHDLTATL